MRYPKESNQITVGQFVITANEWNVLIEDTKTGNTATWCCAEDTGELTGDEVQTLTTSQYNRLFNNPDLEEWVNHHYEVTVTPPED